MSKDIFSSLNDLITMQYQLSIEQATMQAQAQSHDANRQAIKNIAKNCDQFIEECNNLSLGFAENISKLNKSADKAITKKAWDNVIGPRYDNICKNINNLRDWIPSAKSEVESAVNFQDATKKYKNIVEHIQNSFKEWKPAIDGLQITYKNEIVKLQEGGGGEVNNPNQNLQLEQALKKIQELEQALVQAKGVIVEKDNTINGLRDNLVAKDNVIQEKDNKIAQQFEKIEVQSNKIVELQGKLLDKTEQITVEHDKYIGTKHKLDTHKLKLANFIDSHQDIDGQDQLIEMMGDLQIADNI